MTLFRGLADDLPLQEWLQEHIWPAEQRWVGREFVRDGADLAACEMIRGGTTCCNEMYFFPDVAAEVALNHGLRAVVGMIVIEQPTPWAQTVEEYFDKGLAVHDRFRGNDTDQHQLRPACALHGQRRVAAADAECWPMSSTPRCTCMYTKPPTRWTAASPPAASDRWQRLASAGAGESGPARRGTHDRAER